MRDIIQANLRTEIGKNKIKYIRTQGYLPAVIYGHDKETLAIKIDRKQMERFLNYHSKGSSLDIELDGNKMMVVVKDFQRVGIKDVLYHVDFQVLSANETIRIPVPIVVKNREEIDRLGGVVEEHLSVIEIETLPEFLIEHVNVDLKGLGIGAVIKVADLVFEYMDKVTLLTDRDLTVLSISQPQKEEEEVPEVESVIIPVSE